MGVELDSLTMDQTIAECKKLIASRGNQHVVINAAKIVQAANDEELAKIISSCPIINADGISVVWGARLLGIEVPERVAGIDLFERLVRESIHDRYKIYLLGATDEVVDVVNKKYVSMGVDVVGYRSGYWNNETEDTVVQEISRLKPDLLFVAIPSPAKEFFLNRNMSKLNVGLAIGVGGSFDIVAGKTKRAHPIFQKLGLEWLVRLVQEPRRMAKRYLVGNSKFLVMLAKEAAKTRQRNEA